MISDNVLDKIFSASARVRCGVFCTPIFSTADQPIISEGWALMTQPAHFPRARPVGFTSTTCFWRVNSFTIHLLANGVANVFLAGPEQPGERRSQNRACPARKVRRDEDNLIALLAT